jgi:hypothetical protein
VCAPHSCVRRGNPIGWRPLARLKACCVRNGTHAKRGCMGTVGVGVHARTCPVPQQHVPWGVHAVPCACPLPMAHPPAGRSVSSWHAHSTRHAHSTHAADVRATHLRPSTARSGRSVTAPSRVRRAHVGTRDGRVVSHPAPPAAAFPPCRLATKTAPQHCASCPCGGDRCRGRWVSDHRMSGSSCAHQCLPYGWSSSRRS